MSAAELDRLDPSEVAELMDAWQARERRKDYRAGIVAMILANANRDPKTVPRPFELGDFFESLEHDEPEISEEEALDLVLAKFGKTRADLPAQPRA